MDPLPHEKQICEYVKAIERLRKEDNGSLFQEEVEKLEEKLEQLKEKTYSELTPWQRIMISRHPSRPHAIHYTQEMCDDFVELAGDRLFGNDEAIVAGFAKIQDLKCILIGQEKGHDTESRMKRNFGMASPEGFRKALRLMKLAEKFDLPIVTLIDTPGAYPGLEAEERGQGWAIATNLLEMSQIKVPIIVTIIGEGCSGGALGIGLGDVIGMLEHAYYSVISPEGCASILWKESNKNIEAASALKLNAEYLASLGIIDEIIKEPLGGAHHDPQMVYTNVKQFILDQWHILKKVPREVLFQQRYLKFRRMGKFESKESIK